MLKSDRKFKITYQSDSIDVEKMSVYDAERLFCTRFSIYVHDNGHTIIRNIGP